MKLLVIGGTRFLGRHLVDAALARGHRVTLFHRGRTRPGLFPDCERILGDREKDLARLAGGSWDAVVDTCGFVPRVVGDTVRALAGRIGHYTFVSSISAYAEPIPVGADETAPLARLADPAVETVSGETYGGLKALCEAAAESALPGRVLCARAGLLVGPWDYTDRFRYWVRRFGEGGEVLIPDAPEQPFQWIDARDAAAWIVARAEAGTAGPFNLTGPRERTTLGATLDGIAAALGARPARVPVAPAFLRERGVQPWMELPLWADGGEGFLSLSIARALGHGLALRPLEQTVREVRAAFAEEEAAGGPSRPEMAMPASLSRERERELVAAWTAGARRDAPRGS